MRFQRIIIVIMLLVTGITFAQTTNDEPEWFELMIGPRIGVGYIFVDPDEFTESIKEYGYNDEEDYKYIPVNSSFGISFEQRIVLGETNNHFAFQEIISINGLEQALALPVLAALLGYRDESGFEAGIGPLLSLSGIQIALAVGWTFKYQGINIPIDISYTIPNNKARSSVAITTGFNFITQRSKVRTIL